MGFTEIVFFWRSWTWKKFWHAEMADGATDWEAIIVAKSCVYRENVLDEKNFLVLKIWLGKGACGKWRAFPDATSWRVLRQSEVG